VRGGGQRAAFRAFRRSVVNATVFAPNGDVVLGRAAATPGAFIGNTVFVFRRRRSSGRATSSRQRPRWQAGGALTTPPGPLVSPTVRPRAGHGVRGRRRQDSRWWTRGVENDPAHGRPSDAGGGGERPGGRTVPEQAQHTAFLASVSSLLAGSLDYQETLEQLASWRFSPSPTGASSTWSRRTRPPGGWRSRTAIQRRPIWHESWSSGHPRVARRRQPYHAFSVPDSRASIRGTGADDLVVDAEELRHRFLALAEARVGHDRRRSPPRPDARRHHARGRRSRAGGTSVRTWRSPRSSPARGAGSR